MLKADSSLELESKLFFIDPSKALVKTYKNLIEDLQQTTFVCNNFWANDTYAFLKNLIAALITNNNITLLDLHIRQDATESLIDSIDRQQQSKVVISSFSPSELPSKILSSQSKIYLFTSGTTGQPRKIEHSVANLCRTTKCGDKFAFDVWGLAYSPSHMAGIQVFLQSLLNLNTLVNLFREAPDKVQECFAKYKITHISATPTFYRLLIYNDNLPFTDLQQLTLGGERTDSSLLEKLHRLFPKAKFKNIYASTEAGALLQSNGIDFEVVNKYDKLLRVDNDELLIHRSLIGQSKDLILEQDWYHTNDLVTVINAEPLKIRFIGRKNEMINVGGFKVNPQEVEDLLRTHPKVTNVSVWGRKNSVLGQLLVAKVVSKPEYEISERELKEFLLKQVPEYKIPRKFYFVDTIEMSPTGKVTRS